MERGTLIQIGIGTAALFFVIIDFILKWKLIKNAKARIAKSIKYLYHTYRSLYLRKNEKQYLLLFNHRELGYRQLFFVEKEISPDSRTIESCVKSISKLEKAGFIENSIKTGGSQDLQDELYKITARGSKKSKKYGDRYRETNSRLIREIGKIESGSLIRVPKIKSYEIVGNIIFCFKCPNDIDLPEEAENVNIKAICRSCSIPLIEITGPAGSYSGIESYQCPRCRTRTDSEIYDRDKSSALSDFIKKKLGIPIGTAADEVY